MKKIQVKIIRTSGEIETHDVEKAGLFDQLYKMEVFDIVNLRNGSVMLVDDNGYEPGPSTKSAGDVLGKPGFVVTLGVGPARKPVNKKATELYHSVCVPGTTHEIVGDVVIVQDSDYYDEE